MTRLLALTLAAVLLAPACATDDADPPTDTGTDTATDDTAADTPADDTSAADTPADDAPPPLPEGELLVVEPGGDAICSRGTPFRFYAIGGDPKKIVIDFQGGGACWSPLTCSVAGSLFSEEAPSAEAIETYYGDGHASGLYALDDPANPFHGWTLLHVPYCTGDIHWGDATVDYSDDLTIHHKGHVNAQAALAWLYERYPDPDRVFVTGCSAGSYGAIGHAAHIALEYPDADLTVLGDSGAGVISDSFFADSFPNWNAEAALPTWIPGLEGDILELDIIDLYVSVAAHHPDMTIAQYNTAFDADQIFYFTAMGGDPETWGDVMRSKVEAIRAEAENFRYYVAPGPIHCVHPYHFYFQREVAGVPYTAWLDDLVHADDRPDDVSCEGAACSDDPLCAACLDGTLDDVGCGWCDGWAP